MTREDAEGGRRRPRLESEGSVEATGGESSRVKIIPQVRALTHVFVRRLRLEREEVHGG